MSEWAIIKVVAEREVTQRLRSRVFLITTALICVLVVALGLLQQAIGDSSAPTYRIGAVGSVPTAFAESLTGTAEAAEVEVVFETVADRAAAEAALLDGTFDAVVDAGSAEVVWADATDTQLLGLVDTAWRIARSLEAAAEAGLDADQLTDVLNPAPLTVAVLEPDDEVDGTGQTVGWLTAILLFFSVTFFGGFILMGVVEEKSSAVVEVLLSHVRPHQLLIGKVLGTAVLAMVQFAAAIAAGMVALRLADVDVPRAVWVALPTSLLWMIAGFLLYSTLFALAGSLVSRQEDAQASSMPINLVVTAAYVLMFPIGSNPTSGLARVVSLLPPFAPLLMPLRIAVGSATVVEVVVAAVLLLAATYGMLRFAGRVYARTLLHRGTRVRWGDALRGRVAG